jgi:hypothetical protein
MSIKLKIKLNIIIEKSKRYTLLEVLLYHSVIQI